MSELKTIMLHGVLAEKFGREFKLAVLTAKEATHAIVGTRRHHRYQLGSKVRVRLDSADIETARLTFSIVSNG